MADIDIKVTDKNGAKLLTSGKIMRGDINVTLDESILPSGTLDITENGSYNIEEYENVNVNVEGSSGSGEDMLQKKVDLTGSLAYMFQSYGGSGEELSFLENLNTDNLTNVSNLYAYCFQLTTYPNLKTHNVNNISQMFYNCTSITKIILDTTSVTNYMQSFYECVILNTLDISKYSNNIEVFSNEMCNNCKSLNKIIIRSFGDEYIISSSAFNNCYHLTGIVDEFYNPNGDKDGYIYVPRSMVDTLKGATNWSAYADQIRALEDYTIDGTVDGELDETKI